MIIVCPECSTKFNINADRIPDGGAKVRCSRCKHVFLVEKQSETEETAAFQEEATAEETEFSYDKFQELDSGATEEETFSFGAEAENSLSDQLGSTSTFSDTVENDFSFTQSVEETVSPIEKVFTAEDESAAEANEEVADTFSAEKELPAEPEFPAPAIPEKKGGAVSSIIRILLLLILAILIIGGVFVYMNGTDQLNQTIKQLFGQQIDRPVQTGQITLGELEGKFIQNEHAGELFLIRGTAINNFTEPRAAIQVKGVIFDQNGKPLLQKTVFCGNPIDDQKLQTLTFQELEKIMGNQFGNELSNMKIDSKQSIPFDIVFKDLPKNLSEFSVKVTSSEPASE